MNTYKTSLAAILGAAVVVLSTTVGVAEAQARGAGAVSHNHGIWYFQSPSHNINCEGHKTDVWCAVFSRGEMVKMRRNGRFVVDPIASDPAYDASVLAYGERVSFHGMRCTSLRSGMRCVSKRTGRGVHISRAGVQAIHR